MKDLPELTGRRLKLDDHRIIDSSTGEIVLKNSNQLRGKNDRYHRALADANLDYFRAPKKLGALEAPHLLEIAARNLGYAETIEMSNDSAMNLKSETFELAASAFHEAAFVRTQEAIGTSRVNDEVDDRILMIDMANEALDKAIETLAAQPMTTLEQRLMLKKDFTNVHKDIVCGEITPATVTELRHALDTHLYKTYDNTDSIHARGLGGEIRTLIDFWGRYTNDHSLVALPATVRGDSGYFRRADTHDLDIIHKDVDQTWSVHTPVEVKRRRISTWMLHRYTGSDLVQVRTGGTVHLVQAAAPHKK